MQHRIIAQMEVPIVRAADLQGVLHYGHYGLRLVDMSDGLRRLLAAARAGRQGAVNISVPGDKDNGKRVWMHLIVVWCHQIVRLSRAMG
ncbi:hypothetical protein KB20921_21170 [Edwardsiella ictaluri]|nr:hypothetical protein KH20906_20940 [Edwardsiella ictaluri]BEI02856.1 hypothetical protein KB20921_21170 [Edwardsiella ictaluri]BEI06318.1 hypothetical protein KH201010_21040 [Edwardsiella ictaluri]BEI09780.1 hypothetical protein STU22726_21110 [Edwardsiella ictaluri]BEI13260.1 hypothetical protein STU22816_21130 [Edwardsiella ictaluri]